MNAVVIDIESDDLYPYTNQIWTIVLRRGEEVLTLNPWRHLDVQQKMLDFIFSQPDPIIIGHNFLGFDGWVLWRQLGLNIHVGKDTLCGRPVTFFDTLFASQFLYPDRFDGHSLESWGVRLGFPKINYRKIALELGIIQPHENEFVRWSPQMDEYCVQDTLVTQKVFDELYPQIEVMNAYKLGQKNFYLMQAQAYTGFKFDKEKAVELQAKVAQMITDLKAEVEPDLPKRKLKKAEESYYTIPAKPFNKDGKFSATMQNFIQRHKAFTFHNEVISAYGKTIKIVPGTPVIDGLPMSLSDQKELKEYFLNGTVNKQGYELYENIKWIDEAAKETFN